MVFQVIEAHEENSYPPKKAARLSAPPVKAVSNLKGLKEKTPGSGVILEIVLNRPFMVQL